MAEVMLNINSENKSGYDRDGSIPLCVDLDGTLLRSDLLHESVLFLIANNPLYIFLFPWWIIRGKAYFKRKVASRVYSKFQVSDLPYDSRVLKWLRGLEGRPRILCTASDMLLARQIAEHLGIFNEVIASDGIENLSGKKKAEVLVGKFGDKGFEYVGNSRVDLAVWRFAAAAVVVGEKALAGKAATLTELSGHFPFSGGGIFHWIKALRIYQWAKNFLLFMPLVAAHMVTEQKALFLIIIGFVAFGFCASGVYLLNDLLDLSSDRKHVRKRNRPFAAGDLSLGRGFLLAILITVCGFIFATVCGQQFMLTLLCYFLLTLSYSIYLKRLVMIDVILLAFLYTIRIVAGAVAIDAVLSFWMLAFSMFIFLSLALVKRCAELQLLTSLGGGSASGRGYDTSDLPLIQSLGAASGYIGVLVLALYINSPESLQLYSQPKILWLLCPLVLFWISSVWMAVHRGRMHDDPIVFAVSDRVSLVVITLCAAIVLAAT